MDLGSVGRFSYVYSSIVTTSITIEATVFPSYYPTFLWATLFHSYYLAFLMTSRSNLLSIRFCSQVPEVNVLNSSHTIKLSREPYSPKNQRKRSL